MELLIADTFTDSLGRLADHEQKLVKTTAFDLQVKLASPGLQFHRIENAKDKDFWTVRAGSDLRIVVHKTGASVLLCYVDHHDKAYAWAERRKLETHPTTGAAQLVEIRETVREIAIPKYVEAPVPAPARPKLFGAVPEAELLRYGVPQEWLADTRDATEDTLFALVDHLPKEAGEALLELAVGGRPQPPAPIAKGTSPFAHPDAQRRFRVMGSLEELQQALAAPWERWTVFLHPAQRQLVERDYNGPARVSGSAGTGKTIVALHRAAYLARRNTDARVLLTTFSVTLANALRAKLHRLVGTEPRLGERIEVESLEAVGRRMFKVLIGPAQIASTESVRTFLRLSSAEIPGHGFSLPFIVSEWFDVLDAQQLPSWASYRDAKRPGRKSRLSEKQRSVLWKIFADARRRLGASEQITLAEMYERLADAVREKDVHPFDFIVVDEAQDLSMPQLRLLAALSDRKANGLFFAGDIGQRIFQPPYPWSAAGIDIRGRARTLTVNYRTSHQIRSRADRLLRAELSDADGNTEVRDRTVSLFDGPTPLIDVAKSEEAEKARVAEWLKGLAGNGLRPNECAVFVRSEEQLQRAEAAVRLAGLEPQVLDSRVDPRTGFVAVSTMHLAKGLEFKAVAVMACDEAVIPLQARLEAVADEGDLEEVYGTERHLLYVACTRARDQLLLTGVSPASEFLYDLH